MTEAEIFEVVAGAVREVAPELAGRPLRREDSLAELGVPSVDRAEVLVTTLEALDLDVPLVRLSGPRNLGELAARLAALAGGAAG